MTFLEGKENGVTMDATAPRLMRSLAARVPEKDTLYRTKLIEQAAKLHDVIAMGLGDPDLPTPPHIVEAAQRRHRARRDALHASGRDAEAAPGHRRSPAGRNTASTTSPRKRW